MKAGILAVCVCMCVSVGALAAPPRYSIRGIESPDPLYSTWGNSLNDSGEVVGVLVAYNTPTRAFIWSGSGAAQMLASPATSANAINNRGDVLVISDSGTLVRSADGSVRPLASPPGVEWSQSNDINDDGTILMVGWRGPGQPARSFRLHGNGTSDQVDGFYPYSQMGAMNAHGAAAGQVEDGAMVHAAVWEAGGTLRLLADPPQATRPRALAMNDAGLVVGEYDYSEDGAPRIGMAVWRPDGELQLIPFLAGHDVYSQGPRGINNRGDVVGNINLTSHSNRAFLWNEAEGVMDLQTLLDESGAGWQLEWATDINDAGQIIGLGIYQGVEQTFIMTPIPEPGVVGFVGAVFVLMLGRRELLWRQRATLRRSSAAAAAADSDATRGSA